MASICRARHVLAPRGPLAAASLAMRREYTHIPSTFGKPFTNGSLSRSSRPAVAMLMRPATSLGLSPARQQYFSTTNNPVDDNRYEVDESSTSLKDFPLTIISSNGVSSELSLPLPGMKCAMVVNTASQSRVAGKQLQNLQRLWEQYRSQGLIVVAVPSNDFGRESQRPDDMELYQRYAKHGVTFPVCTVSHVNASPVANIPDVHPLYAWTASLYGPAGGIPDGDFHALFFDREGSMCDFFPSLFPLGHKSVHTAIKSILSGESEPMELTNAAETFNDQAFMEQALADLQKDGDMQLPPREARESDLDYINRILQGPGAGLSAEDLELEHLFDQFEQDENNPGEFIATEEQLRELQRAGFEFTGLPEDGNKKGESSDFGVDDVLQGMQEEIGSSDDDDSSNSRK
eukprot:TRINITY_DN23772_c0_g1_i1.p1 TRINITY_DN23772_c0_g1~~TRINITY_DN23772_c0_g1_i1.p1  ORF type:complete len:404 (-),score=34.25 TRINITY_DN23772_c0_g1_i1:13-1224(-)